jgi:hypothetical protein
VAAGDNGVPEAQPPGRTGVPTRRIHCLAGLLVVLGDERRLLVDPLA